MTFRVEDEEGHPIAEGHDLAALGEEVRPWLRAELAAATPELERSGLRAWTVGTLPREISLPGTGMRAYPALIDKGDAVGVRVLDTPEAQRTAMHAGTRRLLLLLAGPRALRYVRGHPDTAARLALLASPYESLDALLGDAATAAVEDLMAEAGGPAWDEAGFATLRDHVAGYLADATAAALDRIGRILDASRDVRSQLERVTAAPLQEARQDVARQLGRLVYPGFVAVAGVGRLPDVERYLRAAGRRLDRLADARATDLDRMRAVRELEQAYERRRDAWPPGRPLPEPLREVRWLLEELRVSHFAPALGVRGPVSSRRIRTLLEAAGTPG